MVKSPVEGSTAALIRLEDSVAFSNFVRPICLSDHHQQPHNHQLVQHAQSTTAAAATPSGSTRKRSTTDLPTANADFLAGVDAPRTERLTHANSAHQRAADTRRADAFDGTNFIVLPRSTVRLNGSDLDNDTRIADDFLAPYIDDGAHKPLAAAFGRTHHNPQFRPSQQFDSGYVVADSVPTITRHQHNNYESKQPAPPHIIQQYNEELARRPNGSHAATSAAPVTKAASSASATAQQPQPSSVLWTNCQTLGWSRQRDHLQRVQLQIADMAGCENVSIATVNSVCTKAVYQQPDCSEEEFAGSPMMCLLPAAPAMRAVASSTGNGDAAQQQQQQPQQQWALVGLASWRIACAQMGIERPRMYDKIASNTAWIRDTISAL